jgi:hypothetical protein
LFRATVALRDVAAGLVPAAFLLGAADENRGWYSALQHISHAQENSDLL